MSQGSIDAIQKSLSEQVFSHTADRKKAAGRALGTLVEIITYFMLREWGLAHHIIIERRIPEFANPQVTHNVEFSLHSIVRRDRLRLSPVALPVTPAKLRAKHPRLKDVRLRNTQLLTRDRIKRNSAVLAETDSAPIVANLDALTAEYCDITVCSLAVSPLAIVECKRVGVREGMKKGPQTIEKAKQGAYVARTVSALQRIRLRNGSVEGIIEDDMGKLHKGPYVQMIREIISSQYEDRYPGFVMTIGVVSNHGNWFTSNNHNKELTVLAQSYDWLLFLTDEGLTEFIVEVILDPSPALEPASRAFKASYKRDRDGPNRFTKVLMDIDADRAVQTCFRQKGERLTQWITVITPARESLARLREDLTCLSKKPQEF